MKVAEIMHEDPITVETGDSLNLAEKNEREENQAPARAGPERGPGRDRFRPGYQARLRFRCDPAGSSRAAVFAGSGQIGRSDDKKSHDCRSGNGRRGRGQVDGGEKIGCLPVMAGGKLVGIVTNSDLLGYLGSLATA